MRRKRIVLLGIAAILVVAMLTLLFVTHGSSFALVEQLTLEQLTVRADSIVVGTVTDITYQRDATQGNIYTLVTVSVENPIKGSSDQEEIVIKLPGGEVDGLRQWVSDTPTFEVSERVVVFLEQGEVNTFRLTGWYQGKFTIRDNMIVENNLPLSGFISQVTETMRAHGMPIAPAKGTMWTINKVLTLPEGETGQSTPLREQAYSLSNGWQTIMEEDFEGPFPEGWVLSGNATWGKDDYNSYSGNYSAWCAKGGDAGVDPPNDYPNDMAAGMVYGPFSLSDAAAAQMDFYFWLKTAGSGDFLFWGALKEGNTFYGEGVYGDSQGWVSQTFDLTNVPGLGNLCGEPQVWIALVFISDDSGTDKGAFLDDILLQQWIVPVINSVTPSSGSAGTGTEVTISGSNFGSTQGLSLVTFFNKLGYPRIEAPVVSWGNTSIVAQVPARASSGGVRVTTGAGDSNDYEFYVTFGYLGYKWPGPNPMGEDYLVNENTADCEGELAALQAAFQTWNDVSNAHFNFTYGGNTTATMYSENGVNEIMWTADDPPGFPSGWIAVNVVSGIAGAMTETDIMFNDDFNWDTSGSPSGAQMDVQNIATHELGHSLFLLDLYGSADSEKTMYGLGTTGETKKVTLEPDDIAGIRWIYPGYTLTMAVSGNGSTTPAVGDHDYAEGTVVNISATPDSGWQFDSWTGDVGTVADVDAADTTITMSADYSITANFSEIQVSAVTATANPATAGSVANYTIVFTTAGNVTAGGTVTVEFPPGVTLPTSIDNQLILLTGITFAVPDPDPVVSGQFIIITIPSGHTLVAGTNTLTIS